MILRRMIDESEGPLIVRLFDAQLAGSIDRLDLVALVSVPVLSFCTSCQLCFLTLSSLCVSISVFLSLPSLLANCSLGMLSH